MQTLRVKTARAPPPERLDYSICEGWASNTLELRLARRTASGNGWVIQKVNRPGRLSGNSLAFNPSDLYPCIAYTENAGSSWPYKSQLYFARWNGSKWVVQVVERAPNNPSTLSPASLSHPSLAFTNESKPAIAYSAYSYGADPLYTGPRFALSNGSSWGVEVPPPGLPYWMPSLAYDSNGSAIVAYSQFAGGGAGIKAAWRDYSSGNWSDAEVVDADGSGAPSLKLDPQGIPTVSYISADGYLKFARRGAVVP